ncbi:MAG: hypothetical protein ABSG01_09185 [Anaerolineales bacterium]
MSPITRPMKFISSLLSDKSLTKKAYLNALTVTLDYVANLIVSFLLTPLMVAGLGNYFYGMWQVLNRLIGYITPASGRPGFALKATLANQQASIDYEQKRRYVGSTLLIWLLFLPLLIGVGGIVSWFAPYWVKTPDAYVWIVRVVSGLMVANMIVDTLSSVPQVTLQGENVGYKRMGTSVVLVFVDGGFTWLALYFKTGIIGVTAAVIATTITTALFYLWVVRSYIPWFGVAKPQSAETHQMLSLSWWFMGWNLVTSLLLASDVVVLGVLNSVESVTNYTLTKYVPETIIGVIVIIVFGIVPGLGSIIGTGDYERAIRLRNEINSIIWLVSTALGASIILWNHAFISLWVGAEYFSGAIPNMLIVVASMQLAFIRSDGNIIDLTLKMSQKVLLGLLSVIVSIVIAGIFVGYFKLDVIGLCFGIMLGRLILSVGYPVLISRFMHVSWTSKLGQMVRPILVTILLFSAAVGLNQYASSLIRSGIMGWLVFILLAGATGILMSFISFYAGLTGDQRRSLIRRVRAVITTAESS